MHILYYKPTCPFCQRILQMAENLKVGLELKDVSDDEVSAAELLEKSGKTQVPFFLDTEKNVSMYESSDIIDYLRENGVKKETATATKPRVHVGGATCISCEG